MRIALFFSTSFTYGQEHGTRARRSVSPSASGTSPFQQNLTEGKGEEGGREGGGEREGLSGERFDLPLIGSATRQIGPSLRPRPVESSPGPTGRDTHRSLTSLLKRRQLGRAEYRLARAHTDGPMRNGRSEILAWRPRTWFSDARHLFSRLRDGNGRAGLQRTVQFIGR